METTHQVTFKTFKNGLLIDDKATIAVEFPLTIFINDLEYTTLLCSPSNIKALIFGFLKNDFLIKKTEDVLSLIIDETKGFVYVELEMDISEHRLFKNRYITAGCANSAMYYETLDAVKLRTTLLKPYVEVDLNEVSKILSLLTEHTDLSYLDVGIHIAVLAGSSSILSEATDIVCNQAIDKVIGQMLLKDISSKDNCLLISDTITSQTVLKCAKQDIRVIVSLSTPMNLAIKIAESLNIILIGYDGCKTGNVYTGLTHVKV